jgi:hypothetical protein
MAHIKIDGATRMIRYDQYGSYVLLNNKKRYLQTGGDSINVLIEVEGIIEEAVKYFSRNYDNGSSTVEIYDLGWDETLLNITIISRGGYKYYYIETPNRPIRQDVIIPSFTYMSNINDKQLVLRADHNHILTVCLVRMLYKAYVLGLNDLGDCS